MRKIKYLLIAFFLSFSIASCDKADVEAIDYSEKIIGTWLNDSSYGIVPSPQTLIISRSNIDIYSTKEVKADFAGGPPGDYSPVSLNWSHSVYSLNGKTLTLTPLYKDESSEQVYEISALKGDVLTLVEKDASLHLLEKESSNTIKLTRWQPK